MFLISIFNHIYETEYEALENNEEYQELKTAYTTAEKELVLSMTKKQRRMFHECMHQREKMTTAELHQLLSRYAILIPPRN